MTKHDVLVKALTKDQNFRVLALNATDVVKTAQKDHQMTIVPTAALGRTLVATLLLANSVLKGKEGMTVRLNGQGPVGGMVLDADAKGHVKGYLQNPQIDLPLSKDGKANVGAAVGKDGFLEIMKNQGGNEPYTSNVPLTNGKIGDDFAYYLAKSEQIPSAVGVAVDIDKDNQVKIAGGYLIQTMPNADENAIATLEKKLKDLPSIATMLEEDSDPKHMMNLIFGENNLDVVQELPVSFACNCSKAAFAKSIASIDKKDLKEIIDEDHGAEITCNFCGKKYNYSEDELQKMLNEKENK